MTYVRVYTDQDNETHSTKSTNRTVLIENDGSLEPFGFCTRYAISGKKGGINSVGDQVHSIRK